MFEIFVTGHYSSLVGKFGDSFGGVANVSCHCMHTKKRFDPCVLFLLLLLEQENLLTFTFIIGESTQIIFKYSVTIFKVIFVLHYFDKLLTHIKSYCIFDKEPDYEQKLIV